MSFFPDFLLHAVDDEVIYSYIPFTHLPNMKPINKIGKGQKSGYCSTGKGQKCPAANLLFLVVHNNFILAALSKSRIKTVCLQKKKLKLVCKFNTEACAVQCSSYSFTNRNVQKALYMLLLPAKRKPFF